MLSVKLLMIRPEKQARSFVADLSQSLGHEIEAEYAPLITIQPTGTIIDLDGVTGLIFTSANAVELFLSQSEVRHIPAFCVGNTTADIALSAGLIAHNANGSAADLLDLVKQKTGLKDSFLYLKGKPCAFDLVSALQKQNIQARESILYHQEQTGLPDEIVFRITNEPVLVPIFSANGFSALQDAVDLTSVRDMTLIALSPRVVPSDFHADNVRVCISPRPTRQAMIETIANVA